MKSANFVFLLLNMRNPLMSGVHKNSHTYLGKPAA